MKCPAFDAVPPAGKTGSQEARGKRVRAWTFRGLCIAVPVMDYRPQGDNVEHCHSLTGAMSQGLGVAEAYDFQDTLL